MVIEIPDFLAKVLCLTVEEARLQIGLGLFRDEMATLETGAKVAGLSIPAFMLELAKRQIPLHYGLDDFEKDLKILRRVRRKVSQRGEG